MEISIIGFGRFGKLMAKHLVRKAQVFATDSQDKKKEAEELGVNFVSLDKILTKKIIVLAVPMENLEGILNRIKHKVIPGTLVLDVCSLKMFSCKLMKDILPETIEIIGTHPLFGPQSAPNSIQGMKIALCDVRSKEATINGVKEFCESLGLQVLITTPEEHDRQMALSQALTHFIGQVLKNAEVKRVELSTKTFDKLMDIVEIICNDTPALFNNMQTMNSFAKDMRKRFIHEAEKIDTQLNFTGGN